MTFIIYFYRTTTNCISIPVKYMYTVYLDPLCNIRTCDNDALPEAADASFFTFKYCITLLTLLFKDLETFEGETPKNSAVRFSRPPPVISIEVIKNKTKHRFKTLLIFIPLLLSET